MTIRDMQNNNIHFRGMVRVEYWLDEPYDCDYLWSNDKYEKEIVFPNDIIDRTVTDIVYDSEEIRIIVR